MMSTGVLNILQAESNKLINELHTSTDVNALQRGEQVLATLVEKLKKQHFTLGSLVLGIWVIMSYLFWEAGFFTLALLLYPF